MDRRFLMRTYYVSVVQLDSRTIQAFGCLTEAPGCYLKLKKKIEGNRNELRELEIHSGKN